MAGAGRRPCTSTPCSRTDPATGPLPATSPVNVPLPSTSFGEATRAIASIMATGGRQRPDSPLGASRSILAPPADTAASYPQPPAEAVPKTGRDGWMGMTTRTSCLLYTSDAADDLTRVDLGGRRI